MTSIRDIRIDEAAQLSAFLREIFMATYAHCSSAENVADFINQQYSVPKQSAELADPGLLSLVSIHNGEWAGVAQLRIVLPAHPGDESTRGFVSRFYFRARHHGQGLAQQLLAHLIELARNENAECLQLSAWKRAPQALRFYEKCGFQRIATIDFIIGTDTLEDWLMQLTL